MRLTRLLTFRSIRSRSFRFLLSAFGIILGVVGAVLIVTGLVGWCPLYALFKIRTNKP